MAIAFLETAYSLGGLMAHVELLDGGQMVVDIYRLALNLRQGKPLRQVIAVQ